DLMAAIRDLHQRGVRALFQYSGEPDPNDRAHHRGEIHQGSLGMARSAYTDAGPVAEEKRQAYRAHITRMFELAGIEKARARTEAERVFVLESELASVSLSFLEQYEGKSERRTTPKELAELAPNIEWDRYLSMVGHSAGTPMIVTSPKYLKTLNALL